MHNDSIGLISGGLGALVAVYLFRQRSNTKDKFEGEYRIMQYHPVANWILYVSVIFWPTLAFLAWRFPGKTNPSQIPGIILLFLGFTLLSGLSLWAIKRCRIFWNDSVIIGADGWGRKRNFPWSELAKIEYLSWAQSYKLHSVKDDRIWIPIAFSGLNSFLNKLDHEASKLGIYWIAGEWQRNIEMAENFTAKGNLKEAEKHLLLALKEAESFADKDARFSKTLSALASLRDLEGNYGEAETLHKQAIEAAEKALGTEHERLSWYLSGLGKSLKDQGKFAEAEPFCQRALYLDEKLLGVDHVNIAGDLNNLASLYVSQNKVNEAEPLCKRAQEVAKKAYDKDHSMAPAVSIALNGLAELYLKKEDYAQAESFCKEALSFTEKVFGPKDLFLVKILENYVSVLKKTAKYEEAEKHEKRIASIKV